MVQDFSQLGRSNLYFSVETANFDSWESIVADIRRSSKVVMHGKITPQNAPSYVVFQPFLSLGVPPVVMVK